MEEELRLCGREQTNREPSSSKVDEVGGGGEGEGGSQKEKTTRPGSGVSLCVRPSGRGRRIAMWHPGFFSAALAYGSARNR